MTDQQPPGNQQQPPEQPSDPQHEDEREYSADPLLALVADSRVDLSPLTQRLWAQKIPHRVVMAENKQYLYLGDGRHMPQVKQWLAQWQNNQLDASELMPESDGGQRWFQASQALLQTPLSIVCLLVLVAVFGWMHVDNAWQTWVQYGAQYWPQQRLDPGIYLQLGFWELWRPTLLHFSFLHLLMNGFWWWLLARRIERIDGKWALLVLIVACGWFGNAVQWWYGGPAFGGASGVTLGLLAWVAARQKRLKLPYQLPPALLTLMVGWLLLTLMGDTIMPGLSGSAHGAHFAGLVCGFILARLWPRPVDVATTNQAQADLTKQSQAPSKEASQESESDDS